MICRNSNQKAYPFVLPDLPYPKDSFKPYFSEESFDYHHGKHHNTYVVNLNKLLESEKDLQAKSLEELIDYSSKNSKIGIFNNSAQIWNHSFFWHSMKPGGGIPKGKIAELIDRDFGSYDKFCGYFKEAALTQFGSGWAWLVFFEGKLEIIKTSNAETPIISRKFPLIACDVWEHAYYIDYRNKRNDYVSIFLEQAINWDFAESRLKSVL